MALLKEWQQPEESNGNRSEQEINTEGRHPYIVHRTIEDEEHRVEIRDEIRSSGTTWAVLGALFLSFALLCLVWVGQEVRGGRHLITTFFWSSLVLGSVMFVFGLLRKRSRV